MYERLTISEAAKRLGITAEGVRQRIKRQTIESEKDPSDGRTYVWIDAEQIPNTSPNGTTNHYTDALTSQIEDLKADKEHLRNETQRLQAIIMQLSQKIPDAPEQQQESVVIRELTEAGKEVGEKTLRGLSRWTKLFSRQ